MVILGRTGRNFAAGMSGGIAYVWDPDGELLRNCNLGMVELEDLLDPDDVAEVRDLVGQHQQFTGSAVAAKVLQRWEECQSQFVKVMPRDYKRVLMERQQQRLLSSANGNGQSAGAATKQVHGDSS